MKKTVVGRPGTTMPMAPDRDGDPPEREPHPAGQTSGHRMAGYGAAAGTPRRRDT